MKKRLFTLLTAMIGITAGMSAADDLVFKMVEDGGVTIVNDGRYDIVNQIIGYTKPGTTLCFGEIDFGNGDVYFANGAEIAHENPDMEGTLDFYLGHPDEGGQLFTSIDIKGTNAFQYYRTFRYNFYPEGTDGYVFPRGKHTVYMRYNDCEGNIKKVVFYGHELSDDEQGQMADPVYNAVHLPASQATVVNAEEFPETRLNDEGAFGWTGPGLMVKYSGVDFKDGKVYGQIAVVSTHGGSTNPDGFLELYVDNADSEDNMIAKIWTARDWRWVVYAPLAANLTKEISGTHDLIVKWTASTNLKEVQLIEGTPWDLDDNDQPVKVELIDEPLSPNAYGMHFDAMGGIENTVDFMAKGSDNLQFEAANLGYTSGGVVLKFNAVDFKDGQFTRILVDHSSDQSTLGDSTFDFYIDLNHDSYDDLSVLDGDTKLATVKAQGTGNWGDHKKTAGAMTSKVSGEHDLYMVFRTSAGANIHGVYLDTDYNPAGISSVEADNSAKVIAEAGAIRVIVENAADVVVYGIDGKVVNSLHVTGDATIAASTGLYIVKIAEADGHVSTAKIAVR